MSRKAKHFEGTTLEEALEEAAGRLGIPEPDLDFEILETGRKGLFGLGSRNVKISVDLPEKAKTPPNVKPRRAAPEGQKAQQKKRSGRPRGRRGRGKGRGADNRRGGGNRQAPPRRERKPQRERPQGPPAEEMQASPHREDLGQTVQNMLELMQLDLTAETSGIDGGIRVTLSGADTEALVDKDAELLLSLQFVLNRMARRAWPGVPRVQLACDGFRSRRDDEVVELAREVARQVERTGTPKHLHPMNPYERRLVHMLIREFEGLRTHSEGDGFLKKILISPR